eukprot:g2027.t1
MNAWFPKLKSHHNTASNLREQFKQSSQQFKQSSQSHGHAKKITVTPVLPQAWSKLRSQGGKKTDRNEVVNSSSRKSQVIDNIQSDQDVEENDDLLARIMASRRIQQKTAKDQRSQSESSTLPSESSTLPSRSSTVPSGSSSIQNASSSSTQRKRKFNSLLDTTYLHLEKDRYRTRLQMLSKIAGKQKHEVLRLTGLYLRKYTVLENIGNFLVREIAGTASRITFHQYVTFAQKSELPRNLHYIDSLTLYLFSRITSDRTISQNENGFTQQHTNGFYGGTFDNDESAFDTSDRKGRGRGLSSLLHWFFQCVWKDLHRSLRLDIKNRLRDGFVALLGNTSHHQELSDASQQQSFGRSSNQTLLNFVHSMNFQNTVVQHYTALAYKMAYNSILTSWQKFEQKLTKKLAKKTLLLIPYYYTGNETTVQSNTQHSTTLLEQSTSQSPPSQSTSQRDPISTIIPIHFCIRKHLDANSTKDSIEEDKQSLLVSSHLRTSIRKCSREVLMKFLVASLLLKKQKNGYANDNKTNDNKTIALTSLPFLKNQFIQLVTKILKQMNLHLNQENGQAKDQSHLVFMILQDCFCLNDYSHAGARVWSSLLIQKLWLDSYLFSFSSSSKDVVSQIMIVVNDFLGLLESLLEKLKLDGGIVAKEGNFFRLYFARRLGFYLCQVMQKSQYDITSSVVISNFHFDSGQRTAARKIIHEVGQELLKYK